MIEVRRPATLLRNVGLPLNRICRTMRKLKRGLQNRSSICPRKKGKTAIPVQSSMARQFASAAAATFQRNTYRNRNSSTIAAADSRMFSSMLPRILPH